MYVGRAIEDRKGQSTKGLRKRLKEHFRCDTNGKKELCEYKDELNLEILPLKTVDEAKRMEAKLIKKYDTVESGWNKRYESD
jgi:excinuclease UvrABC nuclease subunit